MGWCGLDCSAQDKGYWRALVNTAMNFPVPQNFGKFIISEVTNGFIYTQSVGFLGRVMSPLEGLYLYTE
jgi:hypothetical protein